MIFHDNRDWLKNRFQSMGTAEIISRLADVGRHAALRANLKTIQRRPGRRFGAFDAPTTSPAINGQLELPPQAQEAVIVAANQWLSHRATFFSLNDVPLGDPIDWHRDYSSGAVGPLRYSGLINARDRSKVGDIKYIWELNRLQHMVLLALARAWTGNANYSAEIEKQVISWDRSNPFMMGLNWKSPLEAGVRLISWAYVSFIMGNLSQERETFHKVLRNTIYQHQYFIRKFYSKNSSANNHLIGEMAGLYIGSVFWPWYPESVSWRAFSRGQLLREIERQVEADGVGKERATEYQIFILEFFLLAGALGQAIGNSFPQEYWERINRMTLFLSAISNRTGDLPMFGDGDSGKVISLPETPAERVRALLGVGPSPNGTLSPNLRSILLPWGQAPNEIPLRPVSSSARSIQVFPDGGYCVLATERGGEDEIVIVFDAGPLGLPPLHAHGHADALSFWFSYGGQEFFVDPGTYCYHNSNVWRSYFRGTAAHNTIRVDGEDQSVPGGTFLWHQAADCRIEHFEDTDDCAAVGGFHDGYQRLQDPVIHRRSLRLFKASRTLVITDRLQCQGTHDVELFFHFSEKCQVRRVGPGSFEASNRDKSIHIRVDPRLKPDLYHGCEKPIAGWVSRSFGVKEPSFTLVARAAAIGASQFLTEISAI
jgi:hypothetical protein